ncbi:hypothetical protein LFT44_16695 [Arthrobacter sp. FW306-05-C]|uniref:hypothetical protein n=1 Tax=Arthrobacter sp. FW306-05-C TaxID=2879620 RepID=UPI001F46A0A1|nr:hypothetical protein [Arthrobacter sp. FW306-05-C]UKA66116.1 hypothetical protein LFT44_16695 [Arthrobacter sp. FW306-05-C]
MLLLFVIGISVWIQVTTGSQIVVAVGFALAGILGSYFGWRWSQNKSAEVEGYRQDLISKKKRQDPEPDEGRDH